MAGALVNALGAAAATADAFSDHNTLRHMLRFEAALAQAAAEAGLIPKRTAPIIAKACDPSLYDPVALADAARRTATLTVPVVKALTDEVAKRDAEAAGYVHWGATSQDVIDSAMVLQLGEALPPLLKELDAIVAGRQRNAEHGAGIDHVLAGGAPMHVACSLGIGLGDIGGERLDQRDGQVAGTGRGFGQCCEVELLRAAGGTDRACCGLWNHPGGGLGARQRRLEIQHVLE